MVDVRSKFSRSGPAVRRIGKRAVNVIEIHFKSGNHCRQCAEVLNEPRAIGSEISRLRKQNCRVVSSFNCMKKIPSINENFNPFRNSLTSNITPLVRSLCSKQYLERYDVETLVCESPGDYSWVHFGRKSQAVILIYVQMHFLEISIEFTNLYKGFMIWLALWIWGWATRHRLPLVSLPLESQKIK